MSNQAVYKPTEISTGLQVGIGYDGLCCPLDEHDHTLSSKYYRSKRGSVIKLIYNLV